MENFLESLGSALIVISIALLLLLQFLPSRYTVTDGTEASIKTWRSVVWQLPNHMLSKLGRILRLSSFAILPVGAVMYIIGNLIK